MKEYFSHDYNARADEKIITLLFKEKLEGYGIYWAIVEMVYTANGKLRKDYKLIAFELRTQCQRIQSVIEGYGLFYIKDDFICSESIDRRLKERENRSKTAHDSAMKRWNGNANAMPMQCGGNAIKESKGKERKEEAAPAYAVPCDMETWKAYLELRAKKRATNTPHALGLIVKDLLKLKDQGHNPKAVVEESIKRGWIGVFPLKSGFTPNREISSIEKEAAESQRIREAEMRAKNGK